MIASLDLGALANQPFGTSRNGNHLDAGYEVPRKQGKLNNQQDNEAIICGEAILF